MNIAPIVKSIAKGAAGTLAGLGLWKTGEKIVSAVKNKKETGKQRRMLNKEIEYRKKKESAGDLEGKTKKKGESKE